MPPEPSLDAGRCLYEGKIAEIYTEVKNLKDGFDKFRENDFHEVKDEIKETKREIKYILDKIAHPRLPLWVTWLLAGCSALITGLIVAMVKSSTSP